MTTAEAKEKAKELFEKYGCPENEVAKKVGVPESTISNWVSEHNWKKGRYYRHHKKRMQAKQPSANSSQLNDAAW